MAHTYQSATGVPWARYQPLADVLDGQWEHTIAGRRRRIDRRWAQAHPRLDVASAVDRSHPDADELLDVLLGLAAAGDPAAGPAILKRHCPALVAVARSLDLHRSSGPNRPGPDEILVADAAGIAWMALATIVRLRPRRPGVRLLYEFRRQLLTAILGRRSDTVTPVVIPVLAGDGVAHSLDRAAAEGRIAPTEDTAVANVLCDQILAALSTPAVAAVMAAAQGHLCTRDATASATAKRSRLHRARRQARAGLGDAINVARSTEQAA